MENSTMRTGASLTGAGIGSIWGPGGTAIGASAGGMIGQILFPDEIDEIPGASGVERQMVGIQSQAAEKALGLQGLSASEVSAIGQIGRETQQIATEKISSLPMRMSAFDRSRMAKMLTAQSREIKTSVEDKISRLDPKAQMRNITAASDIAARGSMAAAQVRQADVAKATYESRQRKERAEAFNQNVLSLVGAIGPAYALGEKTDWGWSEPDTRTAADMSFDTDLMEADTEILAAENEKMARDNAIFWAENQSGDRRVGERYDELADLKMQEEISWAQNDNGFNSDMYRL